MSTLVILLALSLFGVAGWAQEKPVQPPTLTSEQKKDLTIASQNVQLWQLRTMAAAAEYEKAGAALKALVAKLTPGGFTLTDSYELVPAPKPHEP